MAHQEKQTDSTFNTLRLRVATILIAMLLTLGFSLCVTAPANAASLNCQWPRCTVYLDKNETNNYAYWGTMPQPPAGPLAGVWYIAGLGLRWFAIQYADKGQCVGFNLSVAPWEGQGLFGYSC